MSLTHILVDFENTKPSAADVALLSGGAQHLWICRGPNEKKYDVEFAEALHALGPRLHFVRCAKSGRNALDMHIAFQMGNLLGTSGLADEGSGGAPGFVVVSRDTDYEPLLLYVRSLGCAATRVKSIREALGSLPMEKSAVKTTKAKTAASASAPKPATAKRPSATKAKPAKKAPAAKAAKSPARTVAARTAAKTPAKSAQPAPGAASSAQVGAAASIDELADKAVDYLRDHPRNRPTRRDRLQSWLHSHLRGKLTGLDVPDVIERLERRGVVRFEGNRIDYPAWA